MNKEMTYSEAIAELENIVAEIEQDDVPVDELLEKVKRASDLITFCKAKLTKTEDEVHAVLESIQEKEVMVESDKESDEYRQEAKEGDEQTENDLEENQNVQEDTSPEIEESGEEEDSKKDVPF